MYANANRMCWPSVSRCLRVATIAQNLAHRYSPCVTLAVTMANPSQPDSMTAELEHILQEEYPEFGAQNPAEGLGISSPEAPPPPAKRLRGRNLPGPQTACESSRTVLLFQ